MTFLLGWFIFRGYVKLPGSSTWKIGALWKRRFRTWKPPFFLCELLSCREGRWPKNRSNQRHGLQLSAPYPTNQDWIHPPKRTNVPLKKGPCSKTGRIAYQPLFFSGHLSFPGGGKFFSATPAIFCNKKRFLVGGFFPTPLKNMLVKMGENLPQFSGWK